MAWAFATVGQSDVPLLVVLARVAEQRLGDFNPQNFANTVWAFATVDQSDVPLFLVLARTTELRVSDFKPQELANTAWAFVMAGEPAPAMLNPILVLDSMVAQGARPQLMYYQMSVQCLAATGQIVAGCALLARAEAEGLLSHSGENGHELFRALLEACRTVGNFDGASRVQAAVDRLGLGALAPMARMRPQVSERW